MHLRFWCSCWEICQEWYEPNLAIPLVEVVRKVTAKQSLNWCTKETVGNCSSLDLLAMDLEWSQGYRTRHQSDGFPNFCYVFSTSCSHLDHSSYPCESGVSRHGGLLGWCFNYDIVLKATWILKRMEDDLIIPPEDSVLIAPETWRKWTVTGTSVGKCNGRLLFGIRSRRSTYTFFHSGTCCNSVFRIYDPQARRCRRKSCFRPKTLDGENL